MQSSVVAQETKVKIVTSSTLSIDDIIKAVNRGTLGLTSPEYPSSTFFYKNVNFVEFEIFGVHQESNTADAYYLFIPSNSNEKLYHPGKISLIRFNSGKWFIPKQNRYLGY